MTGNVEAGTVIGGKYRLDEVIGRGGGGVVWRATQLALEREVALKILHLGELADPAAKARFRREARVSGQLSHPAAVSVLDFGELEDSMFLVMELIHGGTLRSRLDAGPLEIPEAARIVSAVADALEAAHRIHLVHRDIKPENVMLETVPGELLARVRVVDFGLAYIAGEPGHEMGPLGRLTRGSQVFGTPAYMSPEQVTEDGVGPASDIYALGSMLYELVSGAPPFAGKSPMEIMLKHINANAVPLRRVAADRDVPMEIDVLALQMLAKSPLVRPPLASVIELLAPFAERASNDTRPGRKQGHRASRTTRNPEFKDTTPYGPPTVVTWIGPRDAALEAELVDHAVHVATAALVEPVPDGTVVFAPGADDAEITRLTHLGVRVVTDVAAHEIGGLLARLRAGAADVVSRPVQADVLAYKLGRQVARAPAQPQPNPSRTGA